MLFAPISHYHTNKLLSQLPKVFTRIYLLTCFVLKNVIILYSVQIIEMYYGNIYIYMV